MIERIVFYGTMMPISTLLIGFSFYVSMNFYRDHLRTKDLNPNRHIVTGKYEFIPFFLLGLCALIGCISFIIGFEYGIIKWI